MSGDGRRRLRVGGTLRAHLIELLGRELGDPKLNGVVVTGVELPDDLSVAYVNVRLLNAAATPAQTKAALRSLEKAAPRLRRLLGPRLGLRRVPDLRFAHDTGLDASRRVEEILAEIASEARERDDH